LRELPSWARQAELHETLFLAAGTEIPDALSAIVGAFGGPRDENDEQRSYPDLLTLADIGDFAESLRLIYPHLDRPSRPPVGALLALHRRVANMPPGRAAILLTNPDSPVPRIAAAGNAKKSIHVVTWSDPGVSVTIPALESDLHTWTVGQGLFVPDRFAETIGVLYIEPVAIANAHANWFFMLRALETLLPLLAADGMAIIGGADLPRIALALGAITPLTPDRADDHLKLTRDVRIAYQGRFGVSDVQSRPYVMLARNLSESGHARLRRLHGEETRFHGRPWTLTHQFDAAIPTVPLDHLLRLDDGPDMCANAILVPGRTIPVTLNRTLEPFDQAWRNYFAGEYHAPEIRLTRLSPGILVGYMPWLPASPDGQVIAGHLGFSKFARELLGADFIDRDILQKRLDGVPYMDNVRFDRGQFANFIPIINGTVETPVFWASAAWSQHVSHFLHEVTPQIGLWQRYLRPAGVKLAMILTTDFQREVLRSLGVADSEILNLLTMGGVRFRHLFFSHAFDDSLSPHYDFLPEMTYFARKTAFSDPGRTRHRRVYAARTDTPLRRIVNEQELIDRLRERDFIIYEGTKTSTPEAVRLFEEADIVVGAHGTNLCFLICCDESVAFLEILSEAFYDPNLMKLFNLFGKYYDNVRAPIVESDGLSGRDRECRVDVDLVLAKLDALLARRARDRP
jgi:hypothetical protein